MKDPGKIYIYIACLAASPAPFSVSSQRLPLNLFPYSHFLIQRLERQNIPVKELMALCPVVVELFCSPSSAVLCKVEHLLPPLLAGREGEGRQSHCEEGFLEITAP